MSNIKLTLTNTASYAEEGQINPLKWKCLYREPGTNNFKDTSGWWICKDFLNDCVAYYAIGYKFGVYGWGNAIQKNDEGMYLLLKNVKDRDLFLQNLEVINKRMNEDLGVVLAAMPLEPVDQLIILIPTELFKNTYLISEITLLIRLSNYGKKFSAWKDFFGDILHHDKPHVDMAPFGKFASENGFHIPQQFQKYWYYCGPTSNSETNPKGQSYTIHNCGVVSWVMAMNTQMKKEKVAA